MIDKPHQSMLLRRASLAGAAGLIVATILGLLLPKVGTASVLYPWLSDIFLRQQDIYFLAPVLAFLLLQPRHAGCGEVTGEPAVARMPMDTSRIVLPLLVLLVLLCWGGHYWIMRGYDLSRDEQMANFDAFIFSHGRVYWPSPVAWRPFTAALNDLFFLPIGQHEGWVSTYLPVNALLRAAVGRLADPALTSPLLVGLGGFALWRSCLRLLPDSPGSRWVALILYAGSAQILANGMTAFAMSAHLALDMLWLMFFLRDDRRGHAAAAVTGFAATGIHQPLFHPLFVLPFLILLGRRQRWRSLAFYLVCYALICAFWLAWPHWVAGHVTSPPPLATASEGGYLDRLIRLLGDHSVSTTWLMAVNLLRFATWQHFLLLPLMLTGMAVTWRGGGIGRALTVSFWLPFVVVAILLPYQGPGWGYRYLHGVLGNACLLGAFGWQWAARRGPDMRAPMIWASASTFFVSLPIHAVIAQHFVTPFADTDRAIAAIPADFVVVDDNATFRARDLVLNRPDLGNRPIRLLGGRLTPETLAPLCRGRTIHFAGEPDLKAIGDLFQSREAPADAAHFAALRNAVARSGCTIVG